MWRLSAKSKLGDTWHLSTGGDERPFARCNINVRLFVNPTRDEQPTSERCCGRCMNIEWQRMQMEKSSEKVA